MGLSLHTALIKKCRFYTQTLFSTNLFNAPNSTLYSAVVRKFSKSYHKLIYPHHTFKLMQEILSKIQPTKEEQLHFLQATASFLKQLNSKLKDAQAILGGSGAKGTWLSGNFDVDIFVLYNYDKFSKKSSQISQLLEPILKKSFPKIPLVKVHGSRDYFQMIYHDIHFEIIPILRINKAEQALNITDISPLHSIWVNKHTKNLKGDILLAKKFCKAQDCYGAESHIGGFSGYILEILIAYYGSFLNLLKAAVKWKEHDVIDAEKYYPSAAAALFQMNSSKLQSPLVVIDPVDKRRNAAAALSLDKFHLLQQKAKEFLKKSDVHFFEKEILTLKKVKKLAGKNPFLLLELHPLEGKTDIVGMKIIKIWEFLQAELKPFGIKKTFWQWDEEKPALMYFILETETLPEYTVHAGPPIRLKEHSVAFKKQYPQTYIEKDRLMAKVKTPVPKLHDFLKKILVHNYVKEKVGKISVLK